MMGAVHGMLYAYGVGGLAVGAGAARSPSQRTHGKCVFTAFHSRWSAVQYSQPSRSARARY